MQICLIYEIIMGRMKEEGGKPLKYLKDNSNVEVHIVTR